LAFLSSEGFEKVVDVIHPGYSFAEAVMAMAVFYKIVKLVKNSVLMIIHIYAKVSHSKISK
jgi:hypothetical protein